MSIQSAQSAFQQQVFFNLDQDVLGSGVQLPVPADRRFVIEQVSGGANPPLGQPGQRINYYIVSTTVNGARADYFFDPANNPKFSCNQQVRIYADPKTNVELFADRNQADGTAEVFMSVSGYLVDFP